MRYYSTRNENLNYNFQEAILQGIAPDGGLFVPERIPAISREELESYRELDYRELIFNIFKKFEVNFPDEQLREMIERAFSRFDHPEIAPLANLKDGIYLLELFHGPTAAFKDMALQVMPIFFEESLRNLNRRRKEEGLKPLTYLILVATSGDTGTAALEGFKNKDHIEITVLYPKGGVSDLQELQMVTQDGYNQHVFGIEGDFDAAQNSVKHIFTDKDFIEKLTRYDVKLSSANSINWGRLLPQIGYYVYSYIQLLRNNRIKMGDEILVTVPTGNFGNILAAFYAIKMGVPIRKLICASNRNNILYEFLTTGKYDLRNKSLIKTPSPSMDILISSNLERLLYHITRSPQKVATWMEQLKKEGYFEVDSSTLEEIRKYFEAGWVDNDTTLSNIREVYEETGYLMDPHTSVGEKVAEQYIRNMETDLPMIVASTAHWAKFGIDVFKALHGYGYDAADIPEIEQKSGVEIVREISRMTGKSIPEAIDSLDRKEVIHKTVLPADVKTIERELLRILGHREI